MSDRLSRFIQNEIDQINIHLPKNVVSLRRVELMKEPGVILRDGSFTEFEPEELDWLKSKIAKKHWGHVLLPIIITRRRDLGEGAFIVGGSDVNLYLILSLLEELTDFELWRNIKPESTILYKPQIKIIRKRLRTTSVIAFS